MNVVCEGDIFLRYLQCIMKIINGQCTYLNIGLAENFLSV